MRLLLHVSQIQNFKAYMNRCKLFKTVSILFSIEPLLETGYWLGEWHNIFYLHRHTRVVRNGKKLDIIAEFDFLSNNASYPYNICNGCSMPTGDAYFSGHLVLFHFEPCMRSNIEIFVLFPDVPRYFTFTLYCIYVSYKQLTLIDKTITFCCNWKM